MNEQLIAISFCHRKPHFQIMQIQSSIHNRLSIRRRRIMRKLINQLNSTPNLESSSFDISLPVLTVITTLMIVFYVNYPSVYVIIIASVAIIMLMALLVKGIAVSILFARRSKSIFDKFRSHHQNQIKVDQFISSFFRIKNLNKSIKYHVVRLNFQSEAEEDLEASSLSAFMPLDLAPLTKDTRASAIQSETEIELKTFPQTDNMNEFIINLAQSPRSTENKSVSISIKTRDQLSSGLDQSLRDFQGSIRLKDNTKFTIMTD